MAFTKENINKNYHVIGWITSSEHLKCVNLFNIE